MAQGQAQRLSKIDVFELREMLHLNLDIFALLSAFQKALSDYVPIDSLYFECAACGLILPLGEPASHEAHYHISLHEESLGELVLTRGRPFESQELDIIKVFVTAMVYPLKNSIEYFVALSRSHTDPLTKIANRAAFDSDFERLFHLAKRHQSPLTLMMLDIDNLKSINDTFGHAVGDEALTDFAAILRQQTRNSEPVYRFGGDEFSILLPMTDMAGAICVAERIQQALSNHQTKSPTNYTLSASIGLSEMNPDAEKSDLFRVADEHLYQAKSQGKNCVYAGQHTTKSGTTSLS